VVALDMVYGRGDTAWTRAMRAAGLRAADGRTMLVAQGAASLERWFPGVCAPVEVMRAAVDDHLR
jgi:shikimate 5-dehydrogenase